MINNQGEAEHDDDHNDQGDAEKEDQDVEDVHREGDQARADTGESSWEVILEKKILNRNVKRENQRRIIR